MLSGIWICSNKFQIVLNKWIRLADAEAFDLAQVAFISWLLCYTVQSHYELRNLSYSAVGGTDTNI